MSSSSLCFQHLGDDERRSPYAARCVVQFSRVRLGSFDQLFQRPDTHLGMRQENVEGRCKASDGNEVFLQVVAEIFVKRLAEGVVGVGLENRVSVRSHLCYGGGGYRSSRSRPVQHHDRLPEDFGESLRHDAPDDVWRTARRAWHDIVDRPVGICLCVAVSRQHQSTKGSQTRCDGTTPVNGHEVIHMSTIRAQMP